MDYAAREGLSLAELDDPAFLASFNTVAGLVATSPRDIVFETIKFLGKINHAHLKSEQKIRVNEQHTINKQYYLLKVQQAMFALADMIGSDYAGIVNGTWAEVSKRSWKKNAVDGGRNDQ